LATLERGIKGGVSKASLAELRLISLATARVKASQSQV